MNDFYLNRKKESGVALLVAMLLLSILAFVGINSAKMGILNQKVVANTQIDNNLFHAAETAIVYTKNQNTWVNRVLARLSDLNSSDWETHPVTLGNKEIEANTVLRVNKVQRHGYTLNTSSSLSYLNLEIESNVIHELNAKKKITKGWIRMTAN